MKAGDGCSFLDLAGGNVHHTWSVPAFSHYLFRLVGRVVYIHFSLNKQRKTTAIQQVKPTSDGTALPPPSIPLSP